MRYHQPRLDVSPRRLEPFWRFVLVAGDLRSRPFSVNANGDRLKDALKTLWTLLTAATLHLIWTQHNLVQYEDAGALPPRAWTELSFLGWMASVRRWLRLQDPDCPVRSSALNVLATLRVQGGYRALWTKYPNSLLLAPTAAVDRSHRH
ncbi:Aste57867_4939 [Aphanomyces stellatus]|uniref:Aste57867_4939 protein n=1 Tax=Aphanomyces stellatus TaxID=120398 RepID=A0A485KH00_9STRA|nr:hypothetical protein As57867_004926 [Aphanomyces stellatus]VFT82027.1 Aste57867_4939 [Aphanomyces stellatus]